MSRRVMRVFVKSIVFICIFFHPLSLFAPTNTVFFDLQLHTQQTPLIQPVFVQPKPFPGAESPQFEKHPSQGVTEPAVLIHQTAAATPTETTAGETLPAEKREGNNQLPKNSNRLAESLLAKTPDAFYRLDVPDKVALTFDDGPCPKMTEEYLAVLQDYDLQATFFVIGRQAVLFPETLEKITAQGSELGSHSWKHDRMDRLTAKQIAADLQKTAAHICTHWNQEIVFFRPPYGRGSPDLLAEAKELGQKLVYWDVDPQDWREPAPEIIVKKVMEQVRPGSIIILHEGRRNTLAALPGIIESLQAQGLQPVSVSALLTAWDNSNSSDPLPPTVKNSEQ